MLSYDEQTDWLLSLCKKSQSLEGSPRRFKVSCPGHDDQEPSASIYPLQDDPNVALLKCFVPGCPFSTAATAWKVAKVLGIECPCGRPERSYGARSAGATGARTHAGDRPAAQPLPTEEEVLAKHQSLLNTPSIYERLQRDWMITPEIIEQFQLGWDGERVWIPVRWENNELVNVRKYRFDSNNTDKVRGVSGHNECRVFPYEQLKYNSLLLLEGEKDCCCALAHGFNGVTLTAGAGSFPEGLEHLFASKEVVVCYDQDPPGLDGAAKARGKLLHGGATVKVLNLPKDNLNGGKDLTDYFLAGGTQEGLQALIDAIPLMQSKPLERQVFVCEGKPPRVYLDRGIPDSLRSRPIRLRVLIIGRDMNSYTFPKSFKASCLGDKSKLCAGCSIRDHGTLRDDGRYQIPCEISLNSIEPLLLIRYSPVVVHTHIQEIFQFHCKEFRVEEPSNTAIIEVLMQDDALASEHRRAAQEKEDDGEDRIRGEPTVEKAWFFLGPIEGLLTMNSAYECVGAVTGDPKDGSTTILIWQAKPVKRALQSMKEDKEILSLMKADIKRAETEVGVDLDKEEPDGIA